MFIPGGISAFGRERFVIEMKKIIVIFLVIALCAAGALFALSCGNGNGGDDPDVTADPNATELPEGVTAAPATELPEGVTAAPATELPEGVTAAPATELPEGVTAAPATELPPGVTVAPVTQAPLWVTPDPNATPVPEETPAPGSTEGESGPGIIDNGDGSVTIVVPSGQSSGGIGGNP